MNVDEVKREPVSNLASFWFMFNVEPFLKLELFEDIFHYKYYQNHLIYYIKSDSHLPKKICFNDSPSKMMKKVFYFILKAFFVLKIFEFLSWLFGHVEKTAWLER